MHISSRWSLVFLLLLPVAWGNSRASTRASHREAQELIGPVADPLRVERGDTFCLMGGALAERMQHDGWLELRLQERFPGAGVRVRNLGFSADEVDVHQRTANFGKFSSDGMQSSLANERFVPWDRYLGHVDAKVILAFFGFNESFAGEAGLAAFEEQLGSFIDHVGSQSYSPSGPARLVLFSSIPFEDLGDPNLPDGVQINRNLVSYNAVISRVADRKGVRFVDVFTPMQASYDSAQTPLTINGIHLNEVGNRVLSELIDSVLFGPVLPARIGNPERETLREAIQEKNLLWFNRYRATDGYNVYGNRSRLTYVGASDGKSYSNFEVLQREMDHLDGLVAAHDATIWGLAMGRPQELDLTDVLPLIEVQTNKAGAGAAGAHLYQPASQELDTIRTASGMRVELFADERQFPELVNPVQMAWDTRGRLWVAVWATYPHWTPGQPMNDKLLILEDTDGDGRADECSTFAGNLHNPTGFEFWNGGVLLASQPDLLFLKDTDGDDRADHQERLLHGLSSADTHHGANSFVIGPDGALYFQEGTFHQSQVESIYGPIRQRGACAWRFDPRTWRVERYIPYGFANPHGHVFDRWGQDFITDGTGNANYFALGFSGHLPQPLNHSSYFTFFNQRTRPAGGTEILSSRHFPEEQQGAYLIANVIGFRGIHQYQVTDQASGFGASEREPIVESTSQNFRPVDIEMGPDGAIYFLDWHNALIGHMQHHLRDPSRDATHGRVYRVTYPGRELLQPEPIAGRAIPELLELLKSPEDRTRYRTRLELSGRASDEVVRAAKAWVAGLDASAADYEHQRLEALWLHQQHNRLDRELLLSLLRSADPRVRAAATRVVRHSRHLLPDALELLLPQARDANPRVRLESVVAASFLRGAAAASLALEVLQQPMDKYLSYALGETMRALEGDWKAALQAGEPLAAGNPAGIEYLLSRVDGADLAKLPHIPSVLQALLTRHGVGDEARLQAAAELAEARSTNVCTELLAAIDAVDAGSGAHADHVLLQLHALLAAQGDVPGAPDRAVLRRFAEAGQHLSLRSLGYAGWINLEGGARSALESALGSGARLLGLLSAVQHIQDPALRMQLAATIQALVFDVPELLGKSGPGTGLEVAFYAPRPRNASRAAFAELTPAQRTTAQSFTLDVPPARQSDSFGLALSGTLFVPRNGTYHFNTSSDDGSRLFIDGQLVVNNDGDHGVVTKSGELELSAGPHSILVHYYEAGGGDALIVRWSGPGLELEEIPASVLGSGLAARIQVAAIRALSHVPLQPLRSIALVQRLLRESQALDPTLDLLSSVITREAPDRAELDQAELERALGSTIQGLIATLSAMAPEERTSATAARALQLGHDMLGRLQPKDADPLRPQLASLGGLSIVIRTLPHQMRYDITEFEVQAGMPVSIVFQNNDAMPHNLVITLPGSLAEVGQAAEKLSGQGASAQFIPETDSVLWHTGLVLPGQSERLTFVAPEEVAEHPYVCTYPGHWRVMNGSMRVVARGSELAALERDQSAASEIEVRPFVKDWTLEELLPMLGDGWEASASPQRGRALFEEAGCIKCHTVSGEGAIGGPELTRIQEKYAGGELLSHVVQPSKEVLEEYKFYIFEVAGRADVIGRILKEDDQELHVLPNLLEPEHVIVIPKSKLRDRFDTGLSAMPSGLLVTLTKGDIKDLLLFLQTPTKK